MKCILVLTMLITAVVANAAQATEALDDPCTADPWNNFFVGKWGPGPLIIGSCQNLKDKFHGPYICQNFHYYYIIKPASDYYTNTLPTDRIYCDIKQIQGPWAIWSRAPLCFSHISYGLTERCTTIRMVSPTSNMTTQTSSSQRPSTPTQNVLNSTDNTELLDIQRYGPSGQISTQLFIGKSWPPDWPGGMPIADYGRLSPYPKIFMKNPGHK
jgi:hypothetical protein